MPIASRSSTFARAGDGKRQRDNPVSHVGEISLDLSELVQRLCWEYVDAPGRHSEPVGRLLRLPVPLLQVGRTCFWLQRKPLRHRAHSVMPPEDPALMNDLVPSIARIPGVTDYRQDLLTQVAEQPLLGQALDLAALAASESATGFLDRDGSVEVVPKCAHLYVEPCARYGDSAYLLQDIRPWIHDSSQTTWREEELLAATTRAFIVVKHRWQRHF